MMYIFLQSSSIKLILTSLFVIVGSIFIQNMYFKANNLVSNKAVQLPLTEEDLSHYDGVHNEKLYLGVLGSVFDVSSGNRHYKKGSSYNYFVGLYKENYVLFILVFLLQNLAFRNY